MGAVRDLAIRVEELHLRMKRMEETQTHRHALLYEWCAPVDYKAMLDRPPPEEIDVPDDLKRFFPDVD